MSAQKNPACGKARRVWILVAEAEALGDRGEVHRRIFAAPIDLELEFEPIALVEAGHPAALDSGDMDEGIGLAVIALNEAEALHRVEELDRSGRLLASQLTLRASTTGSGTSASTTTRAARTRITLTRRTAVSDGERLAINLEIGRRDTTATIDQGEAERLPLGQTGQAGLLDR